MVGVDGQIGGKMNTILSLTAVLALVAVTFLILYWLLWWSSK